MSELLARGRGLLTVEAASTPAARRLVLGTPGLERSVGGVLLEPAMLQDGRAVRGCAVGVALDESDLPPALRDPSGYLAQRMTVWAGAGVTFSGWTARLADYDAADAADAADAREQQAHLAASWAVACRDTGTEPVLRCRVPVPPRAPLGVAQARLRQALDVLVGGMRRRGVDPSTVVLEIEPVLPGHRHPEVASPEDAARATLRALREAGIDEIGGVALRAPRRVSDLPAHLDALQRSARTVRWGFAVDLGCLVPPAAARRGRDGVVQNEVRSRLDGLVRVVRAGAAA